jgi:hypothetical protein
MLLMSTTDHAVVTFFDGVPKPLAALVEAHPDELTVMSASGFNAPDPGATEVLVVLGPAVIASLTAIVREHIASKRHVSIKVDGVELTGMSGQDASEILAQLQRESD